jgi:small subunit ribosomal protein S16
VARYRIVAADSRMKRDGRFLETLGYYNPQAEPKTFEIATERLKHWLDNGAQPTLTVKNLLKQDNFSDKVEALQKGLGPETVSIARKPERKRKPKQTKGG